MFIRTMMIYSGWYLNIKSPWILSRSLRVETISANAPYSTALSSPGPAAACGVRRWFLFQLVLLLTKIKQGNWDENVHFTPI